MSMSRAEMRTQKEYCRDAKAHAQSTDENMCTETHVCLLANTIELCI